MKATDADEGVNGRVWYRIVKGKASSTWGWAGCSWSHLGAARSTFGAAGGPHRCLFLAPPVGNEHHNFRINPSSGLVMRGLRPLDREQNSSHVLEVEAYNTEQGPMRSSVRVRGPGLGWGGALGSPQGCCGSRQSFPALAERRQARRKLESPGMEMLTESLRGWRRGFWWRGCSVVLGFFILFDFPVTCGCTGAAECLGMLETTAPST